MKVERNALAFRRGDAAAIGAVVIAVLVYLIAAVRTHAVTAEDLRLAPYGEKIAKWLKIR